MCLLKLNFVENILSHWSQIHIFAIPCSGKLVSGKDPATKMKFQSISIEQGGFLSFSSTSHKSWENSLRNTVLGMIGECFFSVKRFSAPAASVKTFVDSHVSLVRKRFGKILAAVGAEKVLIKAFLRCLPAWEKSSAHFAIVGFVTKGVFSSRHQIGKPCE
jgi:hypothetical protein